MNPQAFRALPALSLVQDYEAAFQKATGVSLKLVAPEPEQRERGWGLKQSAFCALMGSMPGGCPGCRETQARLLESAARKRLPQQSYCHAGLTLMAVPVVAGGEHAATLLSGQVFRREPTERDFMLVVRMLGKGASGEWVKKARKAYFETPVLTAERFEAVLQMLTVFAQFLADFAGRQALFRGESEPAAVATAKQFVQAHAEEPITLSQVVEHVHVSRFYFCKLFKKVTGMTLTEYVSRVRVEKAKALLNDPSRRVSEVVYAAGFGSVPRFNSVFRRYVGMAPREYRAAVRPGI